MILFRVVGGEENGCVKSFIPSDGFIIDGTLREVQENPFRKLGFCSRGSYVIINQALFSNLL